jgi:hypothetical protein
MKVLLSVLFLIILSDIANCQNTANSCLTVLKIEIQKKKLYDGAKERRISGLKQTLSAVAKLDYSTQYTLCDKIYDEYKDFKFDSAYVYAQKLFRIGNLTHDLTKQYESKIKLGSIQLSGGMFKETFDCIRQINIRLVNDSVKLKYFDLKSRALQDLAIYNTDQFYSPANQVESTKTLDSAMRLTKRGSYQQYKRIAQLLIVSGQRDRAITLLKKLLLDINYKEHQRAMVANDLSNLIEGPEKIKLIALAAVYDIRSSTKQTRAIFKLGTILFSEGNLDDAELFLTEALSEVYFYGNKPREQEITAILMRVTAQKLINSENRKIQALTVLIIVVVIALTGIAFVSFLVYSRLKQVRIRERIVQQRNQELDNINKRLLEEAHIKEEYIGYFFNVISGYILKIEKIKRNTVRKLKAGNYEELLQIANAIDVKEERENLFHTFDQIFLKLFPNFITAFNALLKPEDQIWPKAHEVLNTNLRIFALMRLGVNDNQMIANILESAVSTIYTYKIRIKSKALVQGHDFDQKIMEIKFVDIINE